MRFHMNFASIVILGIKMRNLVLIGLLFFAVEDGTAERTIASPHITDWGVWGKWDLCPPYTYVTGMQLLTHPPQGTFKDDRGLTGIRLFCSYNEGDHSLARSIQSSIDNVGKWGKVYFCSKFMTGFQLRVEKSRGAFVDDTATNNVRMYCNGNRGIYTEGDGTSFGKWGDKRLACGVNEAVCGLVTQVEKKSTWDKTGLNNVVMKCCNLPHPLGNCVPETRWQHLVTCENIGVPRVKRCPYSRHIGIGYSDVHKDTKILFEKNGIGLVQMMSRFQSRLINVSASELDKEENIRAYWNYAPSYVWQPEFAFNARLKAEQGTKVTLYQVWGKCGILHVWGTKLKRVEENLGTRKISVKYLDITNDDGDGGMDY